jgi:hypothetical protein
MQVMSETPEYQAEPTTSPVATVPPPSYAEQPAYVEPVRKPNRLFQIAAWVAIAAGSVFIVAVIFFSGFALGAHSGGGYHHRHHGQGMGMQHHGGPPMMPMRPGFMFPGGPGMFPGFGPGGPGGPGMFPGGPGQNGGPGNMGPGPGNSGPGQGQQPTPSQRPS